MPDFLPRELKDAASRAFRDNLLLDAMSTEERELAAVAYETIAYQTVGRNADLARRYNLERARFLRGQVARIAATARLYAMEIGYEDKD